MIAFHFRTSRNPSADEVFAVAALEGAAYGINYSASEWYGTVRERIQVEVGVIEVHGYEGRFGDSDVIKMVDITGRVFTWFTSTYTELEVGDRLDVTGTIKAHDSYLGVRQTIITRCKFTKFRVMTAEEAAQLEELS